MIVSSEGRTLKIRDHFPNLIFDKQIVFAGIVIKNRIHLYNLFEGVLILFYPEHLKSCHQKAALTAVQMFNIMFCNALIFEWEDKH